MDEKRKASKWTPRRLALPAALVSLLMPGFGHLLIGEVARGIAWIVGFLAFGFAVGNTRPLAVLILLAVIAVDAFVLGVTTKPATDSDEGAVEEDAWKPLR